MKILLNTRLSNSFRHPVGTSQIFLEPDNDLRLPTWDSRNVRLRLAQWPDSRCRSAMLFTRQPAQAGRQEAGCSQLASATWAWRGRATSPSLWRAGQLRSRCALIGRLFPGVLHSGVMFQLYGSMHPSLKGSESLTRGTDSRELLCLCLSKKKAWPVPHLHLKSPGKTHNRASHVIITSARVSLFHISLLP